ncbi:MAG: PepSY domain-containing protein [Limisphaerales bacterium]
MPKLPAGAYVLNADPRFEEGSGQLPHGKLNTNTIMRINTIAASLFTVALLAGCASEEGGQKRAANLQAQAKVSQADAQATALAQVPNGKVKDSELEKEKGKLIWSFDIAIPDSKDIKEVAVDAISGKVLSVETETPAQQEKEKAEDTKKKGKN